MEIWGSSLANEGEMGENQNFCVFHHIDWTHFPCAFVTHCPHQY